MFDRRMIILGAMICFLATGCATTSTARVPVKTVGKKAAAQAAEAAAENPELFLKVLKGFRLMLPQ